MLKKAVTYRNFDGVEVTEDFYFNMTKAELVELEVSETGGLSGTLNAIVQSQDGAQIIAYFKKIILMAYGERSPDGKRFIKSPELADAFSHTEAYSTLFMALATDATMAAEFVNGIMPTDLMAEAREALPEKPEVAVTPDISVVPSLTPEQQRIVELETLLEAKNKNEVTPS